MATSMDSNNIPTLENLAFGSFYKELVSKAAPGNVNFFRDWIDQQLVGKVKKAFREKCISTWSEICDTSYMKKEPSSDDEEKSTLLDTFVLLDCILDEYFTELKVHIPPPALESFSKLTSLISCWSPNLKKLEIQFNENMVLEKPAARPIIFCNLGCLTSLKLIYPKDPSYSAQRALNRHDESQLSIVSVIGKCCPVLTSLSVYETCTTMKDMLRLILIGNTADILFPRPTANKQQHYWIDQDRKNYVLEAFKVPLEYLNPLCLTLRTLILGCGRKCCCRDHCDSAHAFALRHLPKLEMLLPMESRVLQLLFKAEDQFDRRQRSELDKAASRIGLPSGRYSFSSPGFLSLTKIDGYIEIKHADIVRTVGSMCPHLKEARFVGESMKTDCDTDYVSADLLKSILNEWPKLETITLSEMSLQFLELFFDKFGPSLTSLELLFSRKFDMSLLACCNQLKHVKMRYCSFNLEANISPELQSDPDSYLPLLENFTADDCLGRWATLIERKSTLVHVEIHCCHIGTDTDSMEWSQVPEIWQQLKYLKIWGCTRGLSMAILSEIIPQMKSLQTLILPTSTTLNELEHFHEIVRDFSRKIRISNKPMGSMLPYICWSCPFLSRSHL